MRKLAGWIADHLRGGPGPMVSNPLADGEVSRMTEVFSRDEEPTTEELLACFPTFRALVQQMAAEGTIEAGDAERSAKLYAAAIFNGWARRCSDRVLCGLPAKGVAAR